MLLQVEFLIVLHGWEMDTISNDRRCAPDNGRTVLNGHVWLACWCAARVPYKVRHSQVLQPSQSEDHDVTLCTINSVGCLCISGMTAVRRLRTRVCYTSADNRHDAN